MGLSWKMIHQNSPNGMNSPASTVTVPLYYFTMFHKMLGLTPGGLRSRSLCRLPKTLKAGGIQLEYGERNHHHVLPIKKDFPSRLGTSSLALESRARVMKVKDISAKWKKCCHFGETINLIHINPEFSWRIFTSRFKTVESPRVMMITPEKSETEGTDVGDEKQRENQPKPQRWSRTKPLRKQGHLVRGLF